MVVLRINPQRRNSCGAAKDTGVLDQTIRAANPIGTGRSVSAKENARQGFWNGSLPPIGYRMVAAEQRGAKTKKEGIAGLKAIRDQAQADTMRAQAPLDGAAQQPVTATMLRKFAATARQRVRIEGGGYRRDHLRALAQKVEVADREVRIMGSKSDLLRTLAAISGAKSATGGVRSSVLDWRCAQSDTNKNRVIFEKKQREDCRKYEIGPETRHFSLFQST